jgi:uncharacterized protein (TIGR03437 family)
MKTKTILLAVLLGACAWRSYAQPNLDGSGNGLLNGTYYMRQVFYVVIPGTGALAENVNVQGNITFNGAGGYSFSGSVQDSAANPALAPLTSNGTYVVSASGQGDISAIYSAFSNDRIVGLVSNGIFIGSTTESGGGYNDLLIAAPIGTSEASNSTLNGSYVVAYFDPTFPGDALLTMSADGQGNIGTVNITSYTGNSATPGTESLGGVTYAFSNGAAQLKLGGKRSSSTMVAGSELLYISPDGSFIFGGSDTGYDMFVGVRAATSAPSNYNGLYYQAGLDLDESAASGTSPLDSYSGSFQALASGQIVGHERFSTSSLLRYQALNSLAIYGGTSDFTYYDSYTLNSDGSSDDTAFAQHYVSSQDGTVRIGYGIGPFLSLTVALQAPSFTGSQVYLNPAGVVNAASFAPFTAQISPGEFLTLYGSGLAPTTASASLPFPIIFNGVQVMINDVAAPIYYVSPTQISVVVPYLTTSDSTAEIYVVNNGTNSDLVSEFTGSTSVGAFTNPAGGLGYAAALHPDYSVISKSSPAQIGETVAVYLTGMGAVLPRVADGAAAPSNPPSVTLAVPVVYLLDTSGNYLQAPVGFSGLAPGFAGLYQINFTIPAGLAAGDLSLEIIGPDSVTFQALLPLNATTASATPSAAAKSARASRRHP